MGLSRRRDLDQIDLRYCPARGCSSLICVHHAEQRVDIRRRELLRFAAVGLVAAGASTGPVHRSSAREADLRASFDVKSFGATADGKTIDTPAVNRAISAAAAAGGGIVRFGGASTPATPSGLRVLSRSVLSRVQSFWQRRAADMMRQSRMGRSRATRISGIITGATA